MASESTRAAHRQLETLFRDGLTSGLTDGQLLERFADRRRDDDSAQSAFEAIVDRHGGMVIRTCRRVLGDDHEAQEAAQATFLVLARRAGSIGRLDSVGGWLHGVATRVASKARVASIRRRTHEHLAAARRLEGHEADDPDRWSELHEELGHLPEKFRAPLVLCYLEGLTQQQAAEQLRWPLGTVQSRLARGRERLKSRLNSRGLAPTVGLLGLASPQIAPPSWVAATVRSALQFTTRGSEAIRAGAWPAPAGLASEVLRAMAWNKLKWAFATMMVAAVVATTGVVLSAKLKPDEPPRAPVVAKVAPAPPVEPGPAEDRTVSGVVIDEKGQPVPRVWVGGDIRPDMDTWENPAPGNIRERSEPFRDPKGEVIPPGAVGKYFEVREPGKDWKPVSPDDIRIFVVHSFTSEGSVPREETAKHYSDYSIRVKKGGWWMVGMPDVRELVRTDAQGRFSTILPEGRATTLHFASHDDTLQAIHTVDSEAPNKPITVTVRPTRLVRARVIEVPNDNPKSYINWTAYSVDAAGKVGDQWQWWMLPNINNHDPDHVKRRFEVRLPVGKWKVVFSSAITRKVVDFEVPPGEGPLDLPDFRLDCLATVKMIGHPAAEIEATDLDGKPVKLADFRGKVVVLDFWANWCGPCVGAMPRLMAIRERFRDKPMVVLAMHDGSVTDAPEYRKAVEPIKKDYWNGADLPFKVLIDRPPIAKSPDSAGPGEKGSGRSAETYEVSVWPSTYLIDREGKMVGKFDLNGLESALEDQFGLPHGKPKEVARDHSMPMRDVKVRGRVVGPDGKPVAGARLKPDKVVVRQQFHEIPIPAEFRPPHKQDQVVVRLRGLKTDANGDFAFTAEEMLGDHLFLRVEAPGLAAKMFKLDNARNNSEPDNGVVVARLEDDGDVKEPLKLGVGVVVTGRVVLDGKPVVGLTVGLNQVQEYGNFLGFLDTTTDDQGRFRFDHVYTNEKFTAFAQTGGLKNGGAVMPRKLATQGDGTSVDLGDFDVKPGRKLAGRVVFSDGKAIPPGTTFWASVEDANGLISARVDPASGRFEAVGLPPTVVSVGVRFPDPIRILPVGYRLSPTMRCVDPLNPNRIMGRLDRDVLDLTLLIEPGETPPSNYGSTELADFKEARAGTIVGVPPDSVRPK